MCLTLQQNRLHSQSTGFCPSSLRRVAWTVAVLVVLTLAGTGWIADGSFHVFCPKFGRAGCPTPAGNIDALVVTHAHIDHIGLIPKFVAEGFRGRIFATRPTVALADVMLEDSAKIQAEDAKYKRRRHRKEGRTRPHEVLPLYNDRNVAKAIQLFRGVDYRVPTEIVPGVTVTWQDAVHILGSASLEILIRESGRERTIIFSGDL